MNAVRQVSLVLLLGWCISRHGSAAQKLPEQEGAYRSISREIFLLNLLLVSFRSLLSLDL